VAEAERQERADRIPAGEVERERRLVRRARETAEVTAVLHDPVRDRKPGRGVVQLDVTGEGCLARQDDGRGEERKRPARGGDRPPVDRSSSPPGKRQRDAQRRERHDEGNRELGCPIAQRREVDRDHDHRQACRGHDRTGKPYARDDLEQQAAPGRDEQEDEREADPAGEKRHRPSSRAQRRAGPGALSGSA
jgi:hypothetical protein